MELSNIPLTFLFLLYLVTFLLLLSLVLLSDTLLTFLFLLTLVTLSLLLNLVLLSDTFLTFLVLLTLLTFLLVLTLVLLSDTFLTFLFLLTFVFILLFKFSKPPKFPPGPPALPLVGSLPFLPGGTGSERFVSDYVSSYGPVTGLVTGDYYLAMINDWRLARTLLAKEEFSGRLENHTTRIQSLGGKNLGLWSIDGPFYHSQKLFLVKQLKQFGFGKNSLETVIVEQAKNLVGYLEENTGRQLINKGVFAIPVTNVLWSMMAGLVGLFNIPCIC